MCGIAGYAGTARIDERVLESCLRLMRRRGPDHAAHRQWVNAANRQVYLLHSRLNIIDLDERANQPMTAGTKSIAFNGELYNYLELRTDLERAGVNCRTTSDTEVLLRSVDRFGWDVLDRCEGMWALALYDEQDGSLTLSRDRFGEKPLYLYRDETGVYFGSEIKFVTALLGRHLAVNVDHLFRYMVNGYRSLYKSDRGFFDGVSELPGAARLTIEADGTERQRKYWCPRVLVQDDMSYAEAVEGSRERLIRSMEIRLRADVPLAFCMSGGIDSNALISIAKRVLGYDVHGFTVANTDERYDEQDFVDQMVRELGLRHTAIPAECADFLGGLRTLIRQHDAPVYTISYFAHWLLMGAIACNGYRIAVSGTAADELFTGYYDHHLAYLAAVHADPDVYAPAFAAWNTYVRPVVRNPYLSDADLFVRTPGFRDHLYLGADEFAEYLWTPWSEPFAETAFTHEVLRNRMLNELFAESVPVILHEDDLNAMYFSIENRSPYLDRHLFEFAFQIPTRHLVQDGRAKAVLRDAVRGIVPDAILDNRRKVGFNAPILSFLAQESDLGAALLDDSPIYEYVRRDKIAALVDRTFLPNSESKFLFNFLNAKLFLEEFAA